MLLSAQPNFSVSIFSVPIVVLFMMLWTGLRVASAPPRLHSQPALLLKCGFYCLLPRTTPYGVICKHDFMSTSPVDVKHFPSAIQTTIAATQTTLWASDDGIVHIEGEVWLYFGTVWGPDRDPL
jgi:hypothetical protein